MNEHTTDDKVALADNAALAALSKRALDLLTAFHHSPQNQRDRLDLLIENLSAIVDELKALRGDS